MYKDIEEKKILDFIMKSGVNSIEEVNEILAKKSEEIMTPISNMNDGDIVVIDKSEGYKDDFRKINEDLYEVRCFKNSNLLAHKKIDKSSLDEIITSRLSEYCIDDELRVRHLTGSVASFYRTFQGSGMYGG